MKTKLTLTVDKKIIEEVKRTARKQRKSVSKLFEEKMSPERSLPDKKKSPLLRLKKLLDASKPVKAKSRQVEEKLRSQYLMKKYG